MRVKNIKMVGITSGSTGGVTTWTIKAVKKKWINTYASHKQGLTLKSKENVTQHILYRQCVF